MASSSSSYEKRRMETTIVYLVEGEAFGYQYGSTNLSRDTIAPRIPITLLPLDSRANTIERFNWLKKAFSDNNELFLEPFFINNPTNIETNPIFAVERVENTIKSFFEKKFDNWKKLSINRRPTWYKYIERDFNVILRDVIHGLVYLYDTMKIHHGNLREGIFIVGTQAKLCNMKNTCAANYKEVGMPMDFSELKAIVAEIFQFNEGGNIALERLNIPQDLKEFFGQTPPSTWKSVQYLNWWYDDYSLWSNKQRVEYLENIYDLIFKSKILQRNEIEMLRNNLQKMGAWWNLIPMDPKNRLRQIFDNEKEFLRRQESYNQMGWQFDVNAERQELRSDYMDPMGFLRFFRNVIVHYDDGSAMKLGRERINDLLQSTFPEAYDFLLFTLKRLLPTTKRFVTVYENVFTL